MLTLLCLPVGAGGRCKLASEPTTFQARLTRLAVRKRSGRDGCTAMSLMASPCPTAVCRGQHRSYHGQCLARPVILPHSLAILLTSSHGFHLNQLRHMPSAPLNGCDLCGQHLLTHPLRGLSQLLPVSHSQFLFNSPLSMFPKSRDVSHAFCCSGVDHRRGQEEQSEACPQELLGVAVQHPAYALQAGCQK